MAPKEKVKRIMTPEQLEKLALARVKAGEARAAMKEDADGAKMAILQKKMYCVCLSYTKLRNSKVVRRRYSSITLKKIEWNVLT